MANRLRYSLSLRREPDASVVAARANLRVQRLVDAALRDKQRLKENAARLLDGTT
jgi:hypothetical protein